MHSIHIASHNYLSYIQTSPSAISFICSSPILPHLPPSPSHLSSPPTSPSHPSSSSVPVRPLFTSPSSSHLFPPLHLPSLHPRPVPHRLDVVPGGAGRADECLQVARHPPQPSQPPLALAQVVRAGAVVARRALGELVQGRRRQRVSQRRRLWAGVGALGHRLGGEMSMDS